MFDLDEKEAFELAKKVEGIIHDEGFPVVVHDLIFGAIKTLDPDSEGLDGKLARLLPGVDDASVRVMSETVAKMAPELWAVNVAPSLQLAKAFGFTPGDREAEARAIEELDVAMAAHFERLNTSYDEAIKNELHLLKEAQTHEELASATHQVQEVVLADLRAASSSSEYVLGVLVYSNVNACTALADIYEAAAMRESALFMAAEVAKAQSDS